MPIIYKAGSVFEAPPGSVLVHSCNGKGVWGAGVAAQFAKRFPSAFQKYRMKCHQPWSELAGRAIVSECAPYWIASLMVSEGFGARRADPQTIAMHTISSIQGIVSSHSWGGTQPPVHFHSPRLNAGHFGVLWDVTAYAIEVVLMAHGRPDTTWTVWTPEER